MVTATRNNNQHRDFKIDSAQEQQLLQQNIFLGAAAAALQRSSRYALSLKVHVVNEDLKNLARRHVKNLVRVFE